MIRFISKYMLLLLLALPMHAQLTSARLNVIGLTCSACSFGTERSIRQLKFVADVKIDLNSNVAEITFKKGEPVSIDQLVKKVYDAGFSVGKVVATYHFTDEILNGKSWAAGEDTYMNLSANEVSPTGDKELIFVAEKYMKKSDYKLYKPQIDAVQMLVKGNRNGHLYFVSM
jgi:copper chaperone CopZ